MRRALVLGILLAVSCNQAGQPAAVTSVSPAPVASPAQSPSPAAPPSPVPGDLPLSRVSFSCRLPINTPDNQGAFISFPTGAVSFDPNGRGLYYDRAFSRRLPVSRQAVSPDGKHYAYGEFGTDQSHGARMHVVDVATGADRVFDTPTGAWFVRYDVLDYAAEGIYLFTNYEVSYGVALMNPTTGVVQPLASLLDIQASAGNRAFWVGTVNPADPSPLGGIETQPNQIDRYSLVDGTRVPWFYRPGTAPRVIGSDLQGHPIVQVLNGGELVLVMNPQSQRSIFVGSGKLVASMFMTISDSHGTWFGTDDGIYLYSGTAFIKVSNQPGYLANGCF